MPRIPARVLAAGLALAAAPLTAQSATPDNPILRRIWALGMDSSQVEPLAQVLFDSIGPRLTGTDLQKAGNDWLVRTYRSWGIDANNERVGTWRGWRRGHSHIDLIAPRQRTLEGTMLGFSPGTRGKNLDATTVILPRFTDSTEFVRWLPQAKGKFVLVAAPQPTCRPAENWEKNAPADEKVRMDSLRAQVRREWAGPNVRGTGYSLALGTGELGLRLEQGGVAGVITSRPKDAWGTIEIFDTYNTRAPAVALSCEDYGLVYRLTERNQGARLRLNLESQLGGEREVFNTIATIPGTEKPGEYVMLSAHFDSWDGSSGATDNGTGTIVMLEAMRILRQVVPHPKRTILVGHWTSEENGLVGSRAFSEDHPEVREGLLALFNQDNGTGRIVRTGAAGLPDLGTRMATWLSLVPEPFRSQVQLTNPGFPSGGGSDDASFACWGLPATSLGAHGWDYGNYTWHTNRDTYDKVVWEELRGNATLTAMLAYLASEEPTLTSRERVNLAELAARAARDTTAGPRRPVPTSWPECQPAPRSTKPRLR